MSAAFIDAALNTFLSIVAVGLVLVIADSAVRGFTAARRIRARLDAERERLGQ